MEIIAGAIGVLDEYSIFRCKFGQRSRFHSNLNKVTTFIHARPRAVKCYKFPINLCFVINVLNK